MKTGLLQANGQVGVLLLLLWAAGCGRERPVDRVSASESSVLAQVGERVLRAEDWEAETARWRSARRPVVGAEEVVREWVERESLLLRARAAGLEDDPAIQREVELLLVSRLLERELKPQLEAVTITAEALRAEYERDLARYTQPARVRLASVFQEVGRRAGETRRAEARARIEEARARVLAEPAPGGRGPAANGFGLVAAEYSDDQASRYRGGDLGWLEPDRFDYRWPRAVLEAGYALSVGEVSDVVDTDAGFYLVMKTDERPVVVQSFEEVEAVLRQSLLVRQRQALEAAYRQAAVQTAGASIDTGAVARLPGPKVDLTVARGETIRPPAVPGAAQTEGRR